METKVSLDVRKESIRAYKRIIEYYKKEIAKLEGEIFSEQCCFEKINNGRIYLSIINKPRITK